MPRSDQQKDVRPARTQQQRAAPTRRPVHRISRRVHLPRDAGRRRIISSTLTVTAAAGAAGKLADLLGILSADSTAWSLLWRGSGALAMIAAGIALFRLWTPDEGWPAKSRGKVIATVLMLAVAAAFFGYQHPWSTTTSSAIPTTTIPGPTAAASKAPAATSKAPSPSGPQARPTSTSLTLPHQYGFDLDGPDIARYPTGTDDDTKIDLEFDGSDVAFSKTVQLAPWESTKPPEDPDACRTAVTTTGLSPDNNRRPPTKGDAYCFITKADRVGHLRMTGRQKYAVVVDLTLWR
ncbi:hypothetical protein [Actinoplanes sp. L3-i22]|uniref:hypothetical protein n=1 Tax=Actinoplanes sp. L3-i22 TaxID=2836373 RepID=UPI001C78B9E7|nr:hypothetical protein [Actinoplanes sp. L3-i22]BCY10374.1 hypothetical protein L3i22_054620 [Actinoplanes sp. L3-i22]